MVWYGMGYDGGENSEFQSPLIAITTVQYIPIYP